MFFWKLLKWFVCIDISFEGELYFVFNFKKFVWVVINEIFEIVFKIFFKKIFKIIRCCGFESKIFRERDFF